MFEVISTTGDLTPGKDGVKFYLPYDYCGSSDLIAVGKHLFALSKSFGSPL